MTQIKNDIQTAVDTALSGVSRDPMLYRSILDASKGDVPPVKKKITLSLALVLVLAVVAASAAVAGAYHGISYFLTEKSPLPIAINEDYLMSNFNQHHNSKHLNASVTDAYWDGVRFYIAYRISPADSTKTIALQCMNADHSHAASTASADILVQEPEFIMLTAPDGSVEHEVNFASLSTSYNWEYENDGSISIMVKFPLYSMENIESISIPIFNTIAGDTNLFRSVLHFRPPTLEDPIPPHDHQWEDASCVSPRTCSICRRTEGGLGYHDFRMDEASAGNTRTCPICTTTLEAPSSIPSSFTLQPGDYTNHVWLLQTRLHALGYYNGLFSGYYSEDVQAAVTAFQQDANLTFDGICRPDTLAKLFPAE